MMDLSDGLASDLGHILDRSSAGAEVELSLIPVAPGSDLRTAACGGEDYKLLLTADPSAADRLAADYLARFGSPLTASNTSDSGTETASAPRSSETGPLKKEKPAGIFPPESLKRPVRKPHRTPSSANPPDGRKSVGRGDGMNARYSSTI